MSVSPNAMSGCAPSSVNVSSDVTVPPTSRDVSDPTDVMLGCAAVASVPVMLVVAVSVVNVPAPAVVPPMVTPSSVPELISMPVTGVVPSRMSSIASRLVLSVSPHASSSAPTTGFPRL